jgi:uncharacterized membrane protein
MKEYWAAYLLFLLVLASPVLGAVIHGSVYDLELNTLSQAVVEIDSTPKQVMVSRNGSYEFAVFPGGYIITAKHPKLDLSAQENLTIAVEGTYVLDLILFPDLEAEDELLGEALDVEDYEEPEQKQVPVLGIILVVLMLAGIGFWVYRKSLGKEAQGREEKPAEQKSANKADLSEILAFIRREGGRTTQKDLRKAIPYSEGKISLMLAELEAQGKVQKIKKGRGNIIILK